MSVRIVLTVAVRMQVVPILMVATLASACVDSLETGRCAVVCFVMCQLPDHPVIHDNCCSFRY